MKIIINKNALINLLVDQCPVWNKMRRNEYECFNEDHLLLPIAVILNFCDDYLVKIIFKKWL